MGVSATASIIDYFSDSRDALQASIDDSGFVETLASAVERVIATLTSGGKLLLIGNGGSAGDAQHIAGEFLCRLNYDRPAIAAIALTTDTSVLTSIGNDYGYERVFERQVLGLGHPGDTLIAISTSGRSANVLRAIETARMQGLATIGFTGRSGGAMRDKCDLCLRAPHDSTPVVQQIHLTAAHILCSLVEAALFPRAQAAAHLG